MSPVRPGSGRAPTTGRFRRYAHSHPARNCPSRCPPPSRSACTSDHQAHSVPHHVQLIPRGYTSDLKATPTPIDRQPIGNPPQSPEKAWFKVRRWARRSGRKSGRRSGLAGRHFGQLGVCRVPVALWCPRLAQLGFGSLNDGHSTTASRKPFRMSFQWPAVVSVLRVYQWKPLRTRSFGVQSSLGLPLREAMPHRE